MSLEHLTSTHSVKIERFETSQDPSGGVVKTWNTRYHSVPVTIQPNSARERMMFAQRQIAYTNKIYSSTDLSVRKDDRITDLSSGTKYVVTGYADSAGRGVLFMIEARNID